MTMRPKKIRTNEEYVAAYAAAYDAYMTANEGRDRPLAFNTAAYDAAKATLPEDAVPARHRYWPLAVTDALADASKARFG